MSPQLQARNLSVRLEGRLLIDIDELVVEAGSLAVIVGGAGSGKTMLAAALCGDVASRGDIRVGGRRLQGPPSRRARRGLAAAVRDDRRIAGCTVREALIMAAQKSCRVTEALDRIPQLATRADLRAELLSGGEQQLLQTACAWCAAQPALVLDSPTVGLAPDAAALVTTMAIDEAAEGTSVVWLEQDPRAAPLAPVGVLIGGRLMTDGSAPAGPAAPPAGSDSAN